jgi:hypothetical protein
MSYSKTKRFLSQSLENLCYLINYFDRFTGRYSVSVSTLIARYLEHTSSIWHTSKKKIIQTFYVCTYCMFLRTNEQLGFLFKPNLMQYKMEKKIVTFENNKVADLHLCLGEILTRKHPYWRLIVYYEKF